MPRIAGQIDRAKNEAILDAASIVLAEYGAAASVDRISQKAGVSKQTIYNHYGSKAELMRALIERRVDQVSAPFDLPSAEAHPEKTLSAYARAMLESLNSDRAGAVLRLVILSAPAMPELSDAVIKLIMEGSRQKLALFLQHQTQAGVLAIDDADQAAGFFIGMVMTNFQLLTLLGAPPRLAEGEIEQLANEATRRFLRAYAP